MAVGTQLTEVAPGFLLADSAEQGAEGKSGAPGRHRAGSRLSEFPGTQQLPLQNAAVPSGPCPGGKGLGASPVAG